MNRGMAGVGIAFAAAIMIPMAASAQTSSVWCGSGLAVTPDEEPRLENPEALSHVVPHLQPPPERGSVFSVEPDGTVREIEPSPEVDLWVCVGRQGEVVTSRIDGVEPPRDQALHAALEELRFFPAMSGDQPVETVASLRLILDRE